MKYGDAEGTAVSISNSQFSISAARPIGVFDSGVGGLTVFREIARVLPREPLVYLGDSARVPYGTKSPKTVQRYALEAARHLLQHGVKMLVVACNTATAAALPALQSELSIPVIGVVEPGARAAVEPLQEDRAVQHQARGGRGLHG